MAPNSCVRSVYMDKRPGSSSSSSGSNTGMFLGKLFPASRHVFCCSGDACNVPDRQLDKETEVLAAAPKEFEKGELDYTLRVWACSSSRWQAADVAVHASINAGGCATHLFQWHQHLHLLV
jgi:hypothetical protein